MEAPLLYLYSLAQIKQESFKDNLHPFLLILAMFVFPRARLKVSKYLLYTSMLLRKRNAVCECCSVQQAERFLAHERLRLKTNRRKTVGF